MIIRPNVPHWCGPPTHPAEPAEPALALSAEVARIGVFPTRKSWRIATSDGLNEPFASRREALQAARQQMAVRRRRGSAVELVVFDELGQMRWSLLEQPARGPAPGVAEGLRL